MNPVGWFEIPVTNMERAIKFYNQVFGYDLKVNKMGELDMAWLPMDEHGKGASGSLCYHPDFYKPSGEYGTVVYFTTRDVAKSLVRAEEAGGTIVVPETHIAEGFGYMGVFLDSEGNRIALHSRAKK